MADPNSFPSLDGLVRDAECPAPIQGLQDGLDPTLDAFDPRFAPTLENLRVGRGLWETRYGISLWRTLPGSGNTTFLGSAVDSTGRRYRLAARGGVFYDYEEDNGDLAFQSVSGGTGLSTSQKCQGVQLGQYFYFTDRTGALKRYKIDPTSSVATVALPAAPAMPAARGRYYGYLETWDGVAPYGWTISDSSKFDIEDATSTDPWPGAGGTARLHVKTTSSLGQTAKKNVANEELHSNTIAFWFKSTIPKSAIAFRIGFSSDAEAVCRIRPPKKGEWFPIFFDVGILTKINNKQWRVFTDDDAPFNMAVGTMVLPGMLEGSYRYRISNYNSTDSLESGLSPISNDGVPVDLSIIGATYHQETEAAFNKCAAVTWASDSGTDATTDKIRIYRSGGVDELTTQNGRDVWIKVGEVLDFSTQLNGAVSAGDTTAILDSVTDLDTTGPNNWLVFDRGTSSEDVRRITAIDAGTKTVTVDEGFANAHADNAGVQTCFLDNVSNTQIDPTQRMEVERDDPPSGSLWVAKSPDRRLWLFGPEGNVAVSSRSTPERHLEHEVFPDGVDPLTRQDPLQGWRFEIGGDTGEQIVWGGFFGGVPTVLTKNGLYQVAAQSQEHWGPHAVTKVLENVGCLNGETVAEVNGRLVWVTEGPRVIAWDGQSAPQVLSGLKVSSRLEAAPEAYWGNWFARAHAKRDGMYYCLFFTPAGQTTNTQRVEWNSDTGVWECCIHESGGGSLRPWSYAMVQTAGNDLRQFYGCHPTAGTIFLLDDPDTLTDAGTPIRIRFSTKKLPLGPISTLERYFLEVPQGVTDTLSVTAATGGSEYGDTSHTYSHSVAGTGTLEIHQRSHFDLQGRWVQFSVTGTVSNRPTLSGIRWKSIPFREIPLGAS